MKYNNPQFQNIYSNKTEVLVIEFEGECQKLFFDHEGLDELCNSCFKNLESYDDVYDIISSIRTIYKDFDEKKLMVSIYKNQKKKAYIEYDNKKLVLLEIVDELTDDVVFKTQYKMKEGITFSISDKNDNNLTSVYRDNYIALLSNKIDTIHELNDIRLKRLSKEDILLCEMYKAFYNENPNFSKEDMQIKFQTMIAILSDFDISPAENYKFQYLGRERIPISKHLLEVISNLTSFGEIDIDKDIAKKERLLSIEDIRITKIIGECIRSSITDDKDLIDILILLSPVLHETKYIYPKKKTTKEISEILNSPEEEIKSVRKLIKKIETNLI